MLVHTLIFVHTANYHCAYIWVAVFPDMAVYYITLYKAMCSILHDSSNTVLFYG